MVFVAFGIKLGTIVVSQDLVMSMIFAIYLILFFSKPLAQHERIVIDPNSEDLRENLRNLDTDVNFGRGLSVLHRF